MTEEQRRRREVGRQAFLDGKPRNDVLDTACTDTDAWQAGWDAEQALATPSYPQAWSRS